MTSRLFQPLALGAIELPNRFLLAPVKTALGKPGGLSTDKHVAYYVRRVTGGTGTIITEPLYVDPRGKEHPKQLGIDGDDKLEGLRALAEAVHGAGGKVFAHLNHGGRAANPKAAGATPEAPSAVPCPVTGATPEAMTADRVREVAGEFIAAAQRAVKAGFDGVELQLGLGYMVAQFWSPRTNKRTDEYGGTKENRARFLREVVTGVRAALGADKALLVRVSAEEKVPEGMGLQDAVEIAKLAKELGADGVHVVTGSACDTPPWYYQHMSLPQGVNEKLAAKIREAVGGPVIVAGRMSDPDKLQALIDSGDVDGFALGRPLLADPDLPNKVRDGRQAQIQLCGACLQGCLLKVKGGGPISCLANPEVGHETETLAKTDTPKHVVIVGGGPAGLQAAITASERGHKVTLLEKDALGGQFALAFLSPGKAAMKRTYDAMLRRAKASGAVIREHTEATVQSVMALGADEVFVATGSEPVRIPIPGLEGALTGGQVLTDSVDAGKRVLVLGGGLIGIEVAEHLAEKGAEVTVVEMLEEFARDMEPVTRKLTLMRLGKMPVTIHTSTKLVSFTDNEAVVSDEQGEHSLGKFDSAVVAVGSRPVNALADALKTKGVQVTVIGDAVQAGQVWDATQSGFKAASTL